MGVGAPHQCSRADYWLLREDSDRPVDDALRPFHAFLFAHNVAISACWVLGAQLFGSGVTVSRVCASTKQRSTVPYVERLAKTLVQKCVCLVLCACTSTPPYYFYFYCRYHPASGRNYCNCYCYCACSCHCCCYRVPIAAAFRCHRSISCSRSCDVAIVRPPF